MDILQMMAEKFKEFQASQEFDKQALLEAHKKAYNNIRKIEASKGYIQGFTIRNPSEHWRPSVPLSGLRPIRARSLEIGMHHKGHVLFGTLCADAHRMLAIMTILEDQFGDAVRLAIYNPALSTLTTQAVRRHYPKGSKVAVKEPYFKQGAQDGVLMLRVDNPEDVEFVTSFQETAETSLVENLLELRGKGNTCFRDEDWEKAIDCYSKCIQLALSCEKAQPQIPGTSSIQTEVKEAHLYSYSNRAEARLKLKDYQNAVEDCDKALEFDHHHLKSLFRKGRAFHALGEYKLACQCFERALEECPTANDIQLLYEKSKKLNDQNQQGKFDLSAYFLNGCKPQDVPEVSNYIGPVLIKKSAGRGRGLFATDNVDVGDFLVVDNAIAISCTKTGRLKGWTENIVDNMRELNLKVASVKQDLEAKIISSAVSSRRILQQLQYLSESEEMKVPPMDLFRINNVSWNNYDVSSEVVQLDQNKVLEIMHNVVCSIHSIHTDSCRARQNERYGLWVLPSFINHSCFPNANCMVVGEAMFVIAARKIAIGEEITIPYFDTFVPLFTRAMICSRMGFNCDCKRCVLERSLVAAEASPLQKIAEYVDSIKSFRRPGFEISDLSLLKNAVQLESSMDALSDEEKQMIRASYYPLYYNIFAVPRIRLYAGTTLPSLTELFDSFQRVVPGNCTCFELFARFREFTQDEGERNSVPPEKVLEVCMTFMGKHEESVLGAALKSVATDVFKPGLITLGCSEVSS